VSAISNSLLTLELWSHFGSVTRASCYFLNNFQHFTRLLWFLRKEKLKGVTEGNIKNLFSFRLCFSTLFFLCHQK
jgi:hypothetical protein